MMSIHQLFWRVIYVSCASQLPSWSRAGLQFRVFCAARFCKSVAPTARINSRAQLSRLTSIGPHGGIGESCVLSGEVTIGAHTTMGPGCLFITGDHPVPADYGNFRDHGPIHKSIVVEEDVFIGARVIILPGVRIGRGAAVGTGAVVTKDVASGATVVGNPAREVRRRQV